ncbi:MAG: TonB family protein [Spirochaetota bacterium]
MDNAHTGRLPGSRTSGRRMLFSIVCSLIIHAVVFIAVQYGVKVKPPGLPEYAKPLFVTLQAPTDVTTTLSGVEETATEETGITEIGTMAESISIPENMVNQTEVTPETKEQKPEEKTLEEMKETKVIPGIVEEKQQKETSVVTQSVPKTQEKISKGKAESIIPKTPEPEKIVEKKTEKVTRTVDKPVKQVEKEVTSAQITSAPKTSEKPVIEMVEKKDTVELFTSKDVSRPQEEVKIVKPSPERWRDFVPEQQKPGKQEVASTSEVESTPIIDVSKLDKAVSGEVASDLPEKGNIDTSGSGAGVYSKALEGVPAGNIEGEAKVTGVPYIEWEEGSGGRKLLSPAEKPEVPKWVQEEGRDLKVVISFLVTSDGITKSHEVVTSSGYTEVDTKAIEKAKRLKFIPIQEKREDRGRITYVISISPR